jgi:hypothetical protein
VFDSATVDVNILMFAKDKNRQQTEACIVKKEGIKDLSVYFSQNHTVIAGLTRNPTDSWVILSPIEQGIKAKIEAVGTPLKDWDINIYRGILTGYNEAFIIDGKKKDELIEQDPKSVEIIRPILRGRDIKRYAYDFADLYILFIPWHFPLHTDSTIQGASERAEQAFREQYPAVYNHLLQHKRELSNRNKAETGIRYEWYALQRWGANYWEDFYRQKIVYIEIMTDNPQEGYDFPAFSFDTMGCICLNTAYIMTGEITELKYILAILNSKLGKQLVKFYVTQLQNRQFRMLHQSVIYFPIPKIVNNKPMKIERLQEEKSYKAIDMLVYELYGLDEEEIEFIESL